MNKNTDSFKTVEENVTDLINLFLFKPFYKQTESAKIGKFCLNRFWQPINSMCLNLSVSVKKISNWLDINLFLFLFQSS